MTTFATKHEDESERLKTLRRFAILDTQPEKCFDDITKLAAEQFQVPIALVSLVDEGRQWFKSRIGIQETETDRDFALCAHAILQEDVLVIPNALEDERFCNNPIVAGGPKIRFYAGAPLKAENGHKIGTLCLIDQNPRPPLTDQEKSLLQGLADIVIGAVEMRSATGIVKAEIESRVNAEIKLEATQKQMQLFIEHAPAAIAMLDRDMRYIMASRRWSSIYDLGEETIIGKSHYDVIPDVPDFWKKDHQRCLAGEIIKHEDDCFKRKDGSIEWTRRELHPWHNLEGEIGGIILFNEVITEQKKTADILQRNTTFLDTVLENIQEGIVACDAEGYLSLFNSAARSFHGLDKKSIPPEEWGEHYDLFQADGETPLEKEQIPLFRAFKGERVENAEMVIAPKGLPPRHIVAKGQALFDDNNNKLGAVVSMQDVTQQRIAEAQFRQAQKMEAVGQLTGGMAHDFNNLLTVILGNLQLLEGAFNADEKNARRAKSAADAAQKGAQLTKRLLAFSRKQALETEVLNVNDLVFGLEDMLGRTLGEMIDLEITIDENLWLVDLDKNQLETAILNLCVNARDAMGGAGKLTIETKNVTFTKKPENTKYNMQVGDFVLIEVTDTGTGIEKSALEKVFEPFFTTKEVGEGTGLGLSMVYGFTKQSDGHVYIYSEVGIGTSVKMYFPRSGALMTGSDLETDVDTKNVGGRERILVVEDDEDVRAISTAMLEDLGYDVCEAENGVSALQLLQTSEQSFDLLFTDIVMPGGISGPQLATKAIALFPTLKVLFTSGFSEAAVLRDNEISQSKNLISKPFQLDDLAKMVRAQLDSPSKLMEVG